VVENILTWPLHREKPIREGSENQELKALALKRGVFKKMRRSSSRVVGSVTGRCSDARISELNNEEEVCNQQTKNLQNKNIAVLTSIQLKY